MRLCLLRVPDRQVQLERGDPAAQELVNSLQVLEIMAGAMAAELKPLVRLQCAYFTVMSLFVFISSLIAITIALGCCPRPLHSILEMWSD